jgi:hypothetical protein
MLQNLISAATSPHYRAFSTSTRENHPLKLARTGLSEFRVPQVLSLPLNHFSTTLSGGGFEA